MRRDLASYQRRSPWDLFREMDEIFNQLNGRNNANASTSQEEEYLPTFTPATDIRENDKGYLMAFDLPGMAEKDVKVEVKEGLLTVTGERRRNKTTTEEGWTRTERTFGRFHRAFNLPSDVDPSKIEAQFEHGELHLFLPKNEISKPVSVPIRVQGKETGEVKGLMERFFGAKDASKEDVQKH